MKRVIILTFGVFIGHASIDAQTIQGTVTGSDREPVDFATVVLQTTDSVYVNSTITDSEGKFLLSVKSPDYRLIVQHLLYETYEKNYSDEYELTIEMVEKENRLDEIVVKGERPFVRLVDGKMTYDMPVLLSGKVVSNAYESILQLPGVREQDGVLALAGANSVTVIINGRAMTMPQENLVAALKTYPADILQSAEIMYSAPPQYHIRGAAINLVLKGDTADGKLQGQLNTDYTQKHYANQTSGISILLPTPKMNVDLIYAFNSNRSISRIDLYSNHLYDGAVHPIEQFNRGDRKSNEHHVRLGLDYNPADNSNLNITYTSQITTGIDNNESSNGTFSHSNTHKGNIAPVQMHNILAEYTLGFGLKTGIEHTSYRNQADQHFRETSVGKEDEFRSESAQNIGRYRFFADQSHALASEWTLNYGGQYMYATDKSSQFYRSLTGKDMSVLDVNSTLKEYTANAYMGFEKSFGQRLSATASLMGEYYKIGDFDEWTLFPALEMSYFVSPSQIMQLSFSSDKVYPAYWEMHGATSYLNGYAELHGNPQLKPFKDYEAQFNYMLKSKYILTVFYNYRDGYSVQLPYQATDRLVLIYKTTNFDYKQTVGANLILPFNIGKTVNSRLTLAGFYDKVKSAHFHDSSFTNDHVVFYAQSDNTVNISSRPNIKMEVSGAYISKNIQGPAELTALWYVNAGLKWTFYHDMAELRLKGSDLFNSSTPDMIMKYNSQNLRMNMIPDSRAVSLSFTFKLGGYDKKHKEIDASRFGTR